MATEANRSAAQQTLDILYDISQLLNTHLDRDQLATCVAMIEKGENPEALAAVVKDLRRISASTQLDPTPSRKASGRSDALDDQ